MDLLRAVVLDSVTAGKYTPEEVGYHIYLLGEARLALVVDSTEARHSMPQAILLTLTKEGHDFADLAASGEAWAWAKERIAKVGGSAAFDTWVWLLKRWRDARLREPVPPEVK